MNEIYWQLKRNLVEYLIGAPVSVVNSFRFVFAPLQLLLTSRQFNSNQVSR